MKPNIRKDIIDSYEKLIHDCEVQVNKGLDIEKNEFLIEEYNEVLNVVRDRTDEEYDDMQKEIEKIHEYSSIVSDYLSPIHPYRYNKDNMKDRITL